MAKKNIHVVKDEKQWKVKREGNPEPLSRHHSQQNAQNAGRKIARIDKVELVIHRPNGQIRDKDSFGNDPFPPRDRKH